jgi:hypothetical protein
LLAHFNDLDGTNFGPLKLSSVSNQLNITTFGCILFHGFLCWMSERLSLSLDVAQLNPSESPGSSWRWLRATSHTRLRARNHSTSSTLIGGKRRGWSKFTSNYAWGTKRSKWMQDGCKAYMASNGSCFMVTWIIFKNHFLEVGLTQYLETMTLWILSSVGLFHFIMYKDPHEQEFIGWGSGHIWLHTTFEDPWPHYIILGASWDGRWTLSFGLSKYHGHGSWLRVWSGPHLTFWFPWLILSSFTTVVGPHSFTTSPLGWGGWNVSLKRRT